VESKTARNFASGRVRWSRKRSGGAGTSHEVLDREESIGYTVLKMLQIMTDKGLAQRDESARPFVYRTRHSQEQTQEHLLSDLVHRAFGGSVKALVVRALAASKSSKEDLREIEQMLDKFDRKKK
jgi:BlaI family transcriptional regulator, penicillinase repressor